jgi:acid phosphatase type 7
VRGNHECRGEYANRLDKHYDLPDGKFYGAFTAGPIRFIVLDDGEDKPDDNVSYSRLAMFEQYRAEQAEWLKREVASAEFQQSAHRVVLIHIPLYFDTSELNKWTCHTLRDRIMPTLTESRIDLVLSGHTHISRHIAPGTFPGQNFDIFVGGGPKDESASYGILEADGESLAYRMHSIDGKLLAEYRKG